MYFAVAVASIALAFSAGTPRQWVIGATTFRFLAWGSVPAALLLIFLPVRGAPVKPKPPAAICLLVASALLMLLAVLSHVALPSD